MSSDAPDGPAPQPPSFRIDPATRRGAYATGFIVIHTRDEFILDFVAGFDPPARVVGRIVATPVHLKRILAALLDNAGRYEKTYGPIPAKIESTRAKPGQLNDVYAQLHVSDDVLGGIYANGLAVLHTPHEFIMDFTVNFPPAAKVTARIIVSPPHLRRIISVLGDNISQYEDRFGKVADGVAPTEQRLWFNLN